MKILLSVLFSTALATTSFAQISGTTLNIGTGNTTQASSGIIGSNNRISVTSANNNLLVGDSNAIDSASGTNLFTGYANGTWGSSNMSAMVGAWNQSSGMLASMAIGWQNYLDNASNCLAVGFNNHATGWGQFLLGSNLLGGYQGGTSDNPTIVVGSYNVDKVNQRFVVGIGTGVGNDANTRKNGLEVSKTGQVTILRQGDVGMGRFGNSGDQ